MLTQANQQIVAYNICNSREIVNTLRNEPDVAEGIKKARHQISGYLQIDNAEVVDHVCRLVIQAVFDRERTRSMVERHMKFLDDGRIR